MNTSPAPLTTTSTTATATLQSREMDEVSIASDFSVIPESLVEVDGPAAANCCPTRTVSTASFLHSEDLQPSLTALETYGKVTFQGIQATYYCDSDIAVTYHLTPSVTPRSSDRVGLYRVGFSSPQDYLGYQWAPVPPPELHPGVTLPLTVVFKAPTLPKEVGEFYQFCYVTHEGQIAGVSGPFQLLRVGASRDVCEVEEDGMVVVRSGESVLHDRINELAVVRDRLLGENKQIKGDREQMNKELEEKTQQLNMCQHHLQALEVKMKRETAEKCELMGRIGQVVEEKGHLEDRLRTLERSLASERTRADVGETKLKEMEEAALTSRKALETTTHSLRAMEEDLAHTKQALKVATAELEEERVGREKAVRELSMWTTSAQADQSEKNSLALKFNSVNDELTAKMEELDASRRKVFSLEEKLKEALEELEEVKAKQEEVEERLEEVEREKSVLGERQEALGLDNTRLQSANTALKERLATLEDDQEREEKAREAAETIASDLSGRLQAARDEYTTLALTNKRLMRKLKKMRHRLTSEGAPEASGGDSKPAETAEETALTASTMTTSSWLQLEEEEEVEESERSLGEEAPPLLSQSCLSQHMASSCCSHSTQQLSEAVNKKMEDIVKELSQQILSLKCQLEEKEQRSGGKEEKEQRSGDKEEEEDKEEDKEENKEEEQGGASQQATGTAPETPPVLYSNSFLRTATTAPVFLPEGTSTASAASATPAAPSTTSTAPSTAPQTAETTTVAATQRMNYQHQHRILATQTPQPTVQSTANGCVLPPPMLPETTPTARHAAVLSQFAYLPPTAPPHDSDDDDFHSTDSDSSPAPVAVSASMPPPVTSQPQSLPQNFPQSRSEGTLPQDSAPSSLLQCPLCSLAFPRGTSRLLEEHVNSHLEHVCPVCSEVFQRNCLDRFQAHVQEHFKEEEEEEERRQQEEARREEEDPSGPWGRHLRNVHLLEID
ncbi:tax1-binding protein 1 homolog [Scylla paramamosain]|uniref:tax1-binding protein 1 homolog n=1 Tax=Scylla paramamosain TaxID=85552 RepID=UPI0030839430